MATITAKTANDMTAWDLQDLGDGTGVTNTATDWVVDGFGGTNLYTFTGTGLTYSGGGGNPMPDGGTLNAFSLTVSGVLSLVISGNIDAADFGAFILADDLIGLQTEWFRKADTFNGSSGNDHLLSYAGDDTFNLVKGGEDWAEGGKGNDTFNVNAALSAGDIFDGGQGNDTLVVQGDFFFEFGAASLKSVETVLVTDGFCQLTFRDENIGSGGLLVDASALNASDGLSLHMALDSKKPINAIGGRGDDFLGGGDGVDIFSAGRGVDFLNGGKGGDLLVGGQDNDSFVYNAAIQSTSIKYDTILDFDSFSADLIRLTFGLNAVDPELAAGALSIGTFDADMTAAITNAVLGKHDAVAFTPDAGTLVGLTFLIIDVNEKRGYQAGEDIVIQMGGTSDLGGLDTSDFGVIG